ncbi:MAG: DUF6412 domain-containing protein [Mycobacteriales bacterium]
MVTLLHEIAALLGGPSPLVLAAAAMVGVLAGAVLAWCLTAVRRTGQARHRPRDTALRERSGRTAFLPRRDPDAAGRPRPRAPSTLPAIA